MFEHPITDIFFDLDHTLWDFEKNSALTFAKILVDNKVDIDLDGFLEVYAPINLQMWALYRNNGISKSELRYQRLKQTFDTLRVQVSDEVIHVLAHDYIAHLSSYTQAPSASFVARWLIRGLVMTGFTASLWFT